MHSQDRPLDGAQVRAVAAILVPDNYSSVERGTDVALLRLASPARLGPSVRPVCLPRASHRFAHGTACWATGWGDVQEEGEWKRGVSREVGDWGVEPTRWVPPRVLDGAIPAMMMSEEERRGAGGDTDFGCGGFKCHGARRQRCPEGSRRGPSRYCSVAQSCPTLWDPKDCSTPGFPVLHQLPEFAQTHVH